MSSQRQTLSFLIGRFKEVGIRPHARFGQNFLIDLNILQVLLDAAQLGPDDVVLEVGTGTGSLTGLMAQQAAAVVTAEIDQQLHQLASEELHRVDNVTALLLDALKNKNTMNPVLLEAVRTQLQAAPGRRWKVASNLPYNVATPIISNLLALQSPPESMTVTIQKELADRMLARPSTKDYGSLSLWIQSQCQVEIVRILPPDVFWPRPKVSSAIIHIRFDPALRARLADVGFFHEFVRAMFFHRRKFLRSELLSAFKKRLSKPQVDAILGELHIDPTARAEQIDVETMIALSHAVAAALAD